MKKLFFDIVDSLLTGLTLQALLLFIWFSLVAGLVAAIVDLVQFFRYSAAFPDGDFSPVATAGAAAVLMFGFSLWGAIAIHRKKRRLTALRLGVSTAMAFLLAFLPRPAIGTGVRTDLFAFLGGLGALGVVLLIVTDPGSRQDGSDADERV